jgi:hypothetical protein
MLSMGNVLLTFIMLPSESSLRNESDAWSPEYELWHHDSLDDELLRRPEAFDLQ